MIFRLLPGGENTLLLSHNDIQAHQFSHLSKMSNAGVVVKTANPYASSPEFSTRIGGSEECECRNGGSV